VAVDLDLDTAAGVPAAVQTAGYRIVQEALTNIVRHSTSSRATVSVRRAPGAVTIEVVDDGAPTGPGSNGDPAGNGVRGMRERAAGLGGTLEAAPLAGGGWQVRAQLPVHPGTPERRA
jgi:signal transduction histidine kinase